MRHTLSIFIFAVCLPLAALAQQTTAPAAEAQARAQQVLKQARAAIWDETKSKPLQSLSITANISRARGGTEVSNEMTLDILLPDKFLRADVHSYGPGSALTHIQAINGTETWSDLKVTMGSAIGVGGGAPPPPVTSPGANDAGRFNEATLLGGGGAPDGGMMIQFFQAPEAEIDRLLLSWLLLPPATLAAEFTYAGEIKVEDKRAHIIEVSGPNDFKARLFIDQTSHQLLMLSHTVKVPRLPRTPGQSRQTQGTRQPLTREEREKRAKEIQEALARASEVETREVEIRWRISDYRNVNGLNLPHHIAKAVGNQVFDQIRIERVKLNPSLNPDRFEKK